MSSISQNTYVYPWFYNNGQRVWISAVESKRNLKTGALVLWPLLDDDPSRAQKYLYSYALVMKRRFSEELPSQYDVHFSLTATGEEVARGEINSSPDRDSRVIMSYKGLLVHPGNGNKFWWVKFPGTTIESIKAETPEEAVEKTIERNLFQYAEKAPAEAVPEPEVKKVPAGPRVRPGSFR